VRTASFSTSTTSCLGPKADWRT